MLCRVLESVKPTGTRILIIHETYQNIKPSVKRDCVTLYKEICKLY